MSSSARRVLAAHSRSFALAARLLPAGVCDEVAVLYAWCRRADDALDLAPAIERAERLQRLRAELAAIYAGQVQEDPLLAAFQGVVARRAIPQHYPAELLDGLETDVGRVCFSSLSELLLYAYRVAGVVGLMMCHVLGARDVRAQPHAVHLGIAMQLTNVCRDVLEDWQRERLYLPEELLCGSGVVGLGQELGTPLGSERREALARSLRHLLELAERFYCSADRGLSALPPRAAWAVRSARLVYAAIGDELARVGYDVFAGRAVVPRWKKCWLCLRAGFEELAARLLGGRDERSAVVEV